jgi:hypothetical protein
VVTSKEKGSANIHQAMPSDGIESTKNVVFNTAIDGNLDPNANTSSSDDDRNADDNNGHRIPLQTIVTDGPIESPTISMNEVNTVHQVCARAHLYNRTDYG